MKIGKLRLAAATRMGWLAKGVGVGLGLAIVGMAMGQGPAPEKTDAKSGAPDASKGGPEGGGAPKGGGAPGSGRPGEKGGEAPKGGPGGEAGGPPGGEDGGHGGGGGGGGPPPAKVVLGDVRMEPIARWREVTGTLRAWRRSRVAAEEPGRVVSLGFEEGDTVKDGAVLVQIDDTIQKLQVARDEAALEVGRQVAEEREAELQRAERELARMEGMQGIGGVSENDIDMRRTSVASWKSRLSQARGDLLTLENNLRESRRRQERLAVKAPFAGVLVQKLTEMGQWVNAGDGVADIVDVTALEARLDVPEGFIANVREGETKVRVSVPAIQVEAEAPVFRVVADADAMSRLVPVRVRLENKEGRLSPGMSISGLIPVGDQETALTVPKDAVLRDDAGTFVYFNGGGAAIPMRVRVRYMTGDRAVIEPGGLAPGMQVIVEGNERIFFPGQPLMVMESGSGGPAGSDGGAAGGPPGGPPGGGHAGEAPKGEGAPSSNVEGKKQDAAPKSDAKPGAPKADAKKADAPQDAGATQPRGDSRKPE